MKILSKAKDGGPDSNVTGFFIVEIKSLFSIVLLRFEGESRANFHSHPFNMWTWLISGTMTEIFHGYFWTRVYHRSFKPKLTRRSDVHKVNSHGVSWAISLRGPWSDHQHWYEHDPKTCEYMTLTHDREEVGR